ncbi:uncharacterized protein [Atheta coriaria]|uniref:uncharacterized protein isoform X2 n=1 Tax=Dalotia coriaria TaxID=877792 RepID=UPI0031F3A69D
MMLIRRIKCDLLTMMAMAILVTHSATETEARPQLQHQPQQPAHSEEAFFPEPSVQINAPRRLRLDNITAHTQEILAKIDQVNRRHGYLKPETPKRSHFVPGYFTADYNYKERVLKGFDIEEADQPAEDVKKMEDYQAQMSVDHVKHIMMNYPYPEYRGYPPHYQSYNTPESFLGYDPYSGQYVQYIPEVLPFYALLPQNIYKV